MAAWVFHTLSTRLREVVVCDARRNRLLVSGSKNDRIDADKLSELLRIPRFWLRPLPNPYFA